MTFFVSSANVRLWLFLQVTGVKVDQVWGHRIKGEVTMEGWGDHGKVAEEVEATGATTGEVHAKVSQENEGENVLLKSISAIKTTCWLDLPTIKTTTLVN